MIEPNRAMVRAIVEHLRADLCRVVIDPTSFPDREGWTQPDYHAFWAAVIERFAGTVVFADGWQYSNGCSYEFLIAQTTGVETLDQRRCPLGREQGAAMIRAAVADMRRHNAPTAFLDAVAQRLVEAPTGRASSR